MQSQVQSWGPRTGTWGGALCVWVYGTVHLQEDLGRQSRSLEPHGTGRGLQHPPPTLPQSPQASLQSTADSSSFLAPPPPGSPAPAGAPPRGWCRRSRSRPAPAPPAAGPGPGRARRSCRPGLPRRAASAPARGAAPRPAGPPAPSAAPPPAAGAPLGGQGVSKGPGRVGGPGSSLTSHPGLPGEGAQVTHKGQSL